MTAMIKVRHKGSFNRFEQFSNRMLRRDYLNVLSDYARKGVEALKTATPSDSGETANAWDFEIESGNGITTIWFTNSHENDGANVAILLIYGHATRNGSYVQGIDFVSPALEPVFRDLSYQMWKEVTR